MHRIGRRQALAAGSTLLVAGLPGCNGDSDDPSTRGPIEIGDFAFTDEEPSGYDQYREREGATFSRGESLWLYAELDGLAARATDGGVQIDLTQRRIVEHASQGTLSDETITYDRVLQRNQIERFYVKNELPFGPDTYPGEYELTVEFTDHVSGTEATESGNFWVER